MKPFSLTRFFFAGFFICFCSAKAQAATPIAAPSPTPAPLARAPKATPTPVFVPVGSPTVTPTPTSTARPKGSPTSTPTRTSTATVTSTYTPTSTPGVFSFKVSPHPVQGAIHFEWGANMQSQEVDLVVYTGSFRPVSRFIFNVNNRVDFLAKGVHEFVWNGLDDESRSLAAGTYLCFIKVKVNKSSYEASGDFTTP